MFLILNILRNEYFVIFLILSNFIQPNQSTEAKFVDVGGIATEILTATETIGKDLNNIYTGWVESSFLYPYYLKGSSYVNTFYGQVNRTGLIVAGAALLGFSGVIFLGELNAIPSLESMAKGIKDVEGILNNILKGSLQFTPFKGTSSDSFDRADVVHDMPGPPYNYDIEAVMNLTSKSFEENKHRKNGVSGGDFTTIDKYFDHPNNDPTDTEKNTIPTSEEIIETFYPYQQGLNGKKRFRKKKPKKFLISKNNGKKYMFTRVKNKYSPKGYSYERAQNPRKKMPRFPKIPYKRKPFRRKRFTTASPFQSLLEKYSGNQKDEEWRGILGLVGL